MSGAAARTGILSKKEGRKRYKNGSNGVDTKNQQKKQRVTKCIIIMKSEKYR